ncbi:MULTISPECIES: peptidoglycan-binding domain-containing protein [Clostridium]|uniref:Peptidoglycan-binding protein n=1 Tax=Clostridium cibarium TaxID=2762247 RepID=A0ABR8PRU7_9CLOT|nr:MULTISPECIES: peptidoglycan-binding domain-containing protein [Clostridium]MBD7910892.1 peptidoglycan-binding protein [Clostridium cibarium]
MAEGQLKVQCYKGQSYVPVDGSKVTINPSNSNARMDYLRVDLTTDATGQTAPISLSAPPIEYSNEPTDNAPYSLYDIRVERDGFQDAIIREVQVFPEQTALQRINLIERANKPSTVEEIVVLPNTLFGDYPEKIPEDPEKPLPPPSSGVVLPNPVVPEFITVHQGGPNEAGPNFRVPYKEYVKNVASSEIYSTWSSNTIRANVFCIISFTLNRIYTEWYRGKGKNFDITNSTAYDHAFNYGRNIYDNISVIVDELFATYVRRFGRKQPLLTQYCDGKNVQCPQWLSQWGSKTLGDQGRPPYEILTNYYGSDLELKTAEQVKGSPSSYPGYDLRVGSRGEPVRVIQGQLNRISENYPLIPKLAVDGVFGRKTEESVKVFQSVFNLPQTGIVDYKTWYKISDVYVGVTRIAELRGENNIFYPVNDIGYRSEEEPHFKYPK